ncbi:PAS domain-containing sensor histidine kinase [Pleurocapsa sp. CCALA 161]|uniref:two-component system sensor histidine kinase NblS n=1 Tax=Pleurocapsa sp. CCALA 161 TaxID=2107688 RepID=UPI000D085699|nr:ATP-binding protein [Pleurocapsa sp. CCALA 161]PSB12519.1 PAS domain-containing sensor histidine kinase [Pleurocapsa sp. CCALA 161]
MLTFLTKIKEIIALWWSEFTLQTKLMAAATLVVSLIMSSLTFWAVNTIQLQSNINDTRFGSDLSILIASNAAPLVAEEDLQGLADFSTRFYRSTSSIRYIIYADKSGSIFFGIPYSQAEIQNDLTIERRISLPEDYAQNSDLPFVRQHQTPNGQVTDVFVPLRHNGEYLGVLAVGINPNPTIVASSNLTRDVTIAVFITIWAMVILGNVFNALMITRPIKELLVGVKNIAAKNFKQRIDLPLRGELGELISSFNLMAEKLENYNEQNVEEITSEKAKLETLVSTIADGAVLIDPEMHIILVNPTAKSIFGWKEDALGDNILHRLPSELTTKLTKPLYQMIERKIEPTKENTLEHNQQHHLNQLSDRDEFRITLQKPVSRTIRVLLSRVLDGGSENIKGIAMTIQDITREVELNEAKSQFISNVSHELRTPLFNIKSFIETLSEYGEDLTHVQRREFLDTANHETDRLTRLVNDVLDLSRLESSHTYDLSEVYLSQPIEQTLRTCQLNAKDKGIELYQEIETDLPPVLGNYDLLLQVLTNLVGNSLKFTNAGGKVTVRAYQTKAESNTLNQSAVKIEIADTGIGISAEDKEAIFERFFRVENRVHTLEGTGLGLSIVRNIIEKHNSRVYIDSEVGVGTSFWFELPIYQAKVEQPVEIIKNNR